MVGCFCLGEKMNLGIWLKEINRLDFIRNCLYLSIALICCAINMYIVFFIWVR